MPTPYLASLVEFSALIGAAEGRPADSIHHQLRGLQQAGVFSAHDQKGNRGAARYDRVELARARLLLAILDMGLGRSDAQQANAALNASNLEEGEGIRPATRLRLMLEELAGERPAAWSLEVAFVRDSAGNVEPHATLRRNDDDDYRALVWTSQGKRLQGRVIIEANALLAPVLKAADA
jgi:hypothetical protein